MRILAIDMGTGTQDILLFDSDKPVENCVKMVMPSATEIAARRIRQLQIKVRQTLIMPRTLSVSYGSVGGSCRGTELSGVPIERLLALRKK